MTKLLKGLNPSKALGPGELHPRVLKELAMELGQVFAHLFQQSIDTGEIPEEWSLANICPLFKKGDRSLARNYRPVSFVTNSRTSHRKPRRWKSMLIHQGWFTALYTQHLLDSQSLEFEICIFPRETIPSHYFSLREDSPESWPGDYMGKAIPVWQLTLSHRCHQM